MSDDVLDTEVSEEDGGTKKTESCGVSYSDVTDAISDRQEWERKQALFYEMRHDGVRRRNKPWLTAADMHFPLADMLIEKLKPYYFQQVFAGETIAGFYSLKSENAKYQTAAAQWFDYMLKQRSNFEEFLSIAVDTMCQGGRAPCLVRWDADSKSLVFEAEDPLRVIVPRWTKSIEEADWIVLSKVWSVDAYKRESRFNQDPDFIKRIAGKGAEVDGVAQQAKTDKLQREGLTYGKTDKEIVIWTMHVRQGKDWLIRTVSPTCFEEPIRKDFILPYNQGVFADGAVPFVQLSYELKEKRYYSARGVCERVAAFEASLNKDWNTAKDWQTLTTQPVFYSTAKLPNSGNISMKPGQVLPYEIKPVEFGSMPNDIPASMAQTRAIAEQLVAVPDFGIGGSRAPGGTKTATEVQALTTVLGSNVELRSRVFRRELGTLYKLAWALLIQYAKDNLDYFYQDQLGTLPVEAADDLYQIEPNGSGDNFNREFVVKKAYARLQVFGNSPYINQGELVKSVLESDDPRLVRRLWQSPDQLAASQAEMQAQEISILLLGFPAAVNATDDHAAHFNTVVQFLQARTATREQVPPMALAAICTHALQHFAAMQEAKDPRVQQFAEEAQAMQRMVQSATQAMQQAQAAQQAAQAQQQPAPGAPSATPPASPVA